MSSNTIVVVFCNNTILFMLACCCFYCILHVYPQCSLAIIPFFLWFPYNAYKFVIRA